MSATREDVQALLDLLTREHVEREIRAWLEDPRHAAIYRELEKEISSDGDYPGYAFFHTLVFCALLPSEEDEYIIEHPDADDIYRCVRTALDCRLSLEEGGIGEFGKFTGLSLLQFRQAAHFLVIRATNIDDDRQIYVARSHLQPPPDKPGLRPVVSRRAKRMADFITGKFRQIVATTPELEYETERLIAKLCKKRQCEGFYILQRQPCLSCGFAPQRPFAWDEDRMSLWHPSSFPERWNEDLQTALSCWETRSNLLTRRCFLGGLSHSTSRRTIMGKPQYLVFQTPDLSLSAPWSLSSPLQLQGKWLLHSALIYDYVFSDTLAVCRNRYEMKARWKDLGAHCLAICLVRLDDDEPVPTLLRNDDRWDNDNVFNVPGSAMDGRQSEPFFFHMPW